MAVLKMLRKGEIDIRPDPDGQHVYLALFQRDEYLHYEKFLLSDFPNDFISSEDLKRFGIVSGINGRAV
jgi:hypothetical protein